MALVHRNLCKVNSIISLIRCYSTPKEKNVRKSVFISQSKDIYTNLALEDWLYRNFHFTNHHVLLFWRNEPCVVIGQHQNPWMETNIANLNNITKNVKLARRNTGGGTIYHDEGNLNMTFFTPRNNHDKNYNSQIISRAIFREYGLKIQVSPHQLNIRNSKQISANASKLGQVNAYYHCNLLVNVNKVDLSRALQKNETKINTNAVKTVKSKYMNLCEENPKSSVNEILKAIGWEFLRTPAFVVKDEGMNLANKQTGFHMLNPTEYWFPGISNIRDNLRNWDWCYGKTPKFHITRFFPNSNDSSNNLKITVTVENGRIFDVSMHIPPGLSTEGFNGEISVISGLKGRKFSEQTLNNLEQSLETLINNKNKFVTDCVRQVMTSI